MQRLQMLTAEFFLVFIGDQGQTLQEVYCHSQLVCGIKSPEINRSEYKI